jgi:hypothetical protein
MDDKRKKFDELQKRYRLPSFNELNKQFDIDTIETDFPLRYVRKRISEFLEGYAGTIEDILYPDSALYVLYEYKTFNDAKKEALFEVYKRLMKLLRQSLAVSLVNSDQEDAKFIKAAYVQWSDIRKLLLPLAKDLVDCWEKEVNVKEELGYLG